MQNKLFTPPFKASHASQGTPGHEIKAAVIDGQGRVVCILPLGSSITADNLRAKAIAVAMNHAFPKQPSAVFGAH